MDEESLKFWTALVALWLIGLHEQSYRAFNARIARLCGPGEFHSAPGLKKFKRIMTKSAGGLHVVARSCT